MFSGHDFNKNEIHSILFSILKAFLLFQKYKNPRMMKLCEFRDKVSDYDNNTHVELVASFNKNTKMMFNRNGKVFRKNCDSLNLRHHACKQKEKAVAFLICCSCLTKEEVCSSGLEHTREMKIACSSENKPSTIRFNEILRNS